MEKFLMEGAFSPHLPCLRGESESASKRGGRKQPLNFLSPTTPARRLSLLTEAVHLSHSEYRMLKVLRSYASHPPRAGGEETNPFKVKIYGLRLQALRKIAIRRVSRTILYKE